jgi:beta-N-acetylhexosaminidase
MQRVAQLVWPAVYGEELVKRTAQFAQWQVGGAVLMTWPETATSSQLQALKAAGAVPLLVATDEEGGNVQRMARLGVIPAAATVAGSMTPAAAEQMIAAHAAVVKAAGVDIVFAPVVDVSPQTGVGPIGNRAFSSDPKVVIEFAQAYVQGWESAGILPVLKHFPGHGSASGDTHKLNATTPALDVLRARDLLPYAALAGTGVGVMVGHLDVPGLTDGDKVPASLSPSAVTGLLRGKYGYADALVFTDALGMKAISNEFGTPEAAERAVAAGADVVIFTSTDDTPLIIDRLADAVSAGRIPAARVDEAVLHVVRTKGVDPCSIAPAG